jgi:hypothetical protein
MKTWMSLLAPVVLSVVACGQAPDEQTGSTSSATILCKIGDQTPPCGSNAPTPAECGTVAPECTISPSTWAAATPYLISGEPNSGPEWVAALQQAGCTTPWAYVANIPNELNPWLFVTECPSSAVLPKFPGLETNAQLVMGCNHCYPYFPPSSLVRLAWSVENDSPGGCKDGSCASLSP